MVILRKSPPKQRHSTNSRPHIEIRRWVETADERCPLACAWCVLPENQDEQDDDSWLRWPALSRGRQAFLHGIHLLSSHSMP